ncbi:MAG: BLUF domain-containing protein [Polaromonas sp.]|uniref:BLUF domain-containing protein n=1 Tax=Polaromonas sp. TaxID=1869339 RepID=UPI002724800C|nr:BLUF domain-containing protein [Polaromonas sp.]MDO9113955.1 BLUF domain-containing protein [Polaromonas sp.]MDP1887364.1 BLUF domain-containing protein [Polaromonas sp.]
MNKVAELHEVLSLSTLAPDAPLKVISDIAARARRANEAAGITGLLVFDGMQFCHHIEGPRKAVLALTERIRQDPRHVDVDILYHGPLAQRRFRHFGLGYTAADDVDVLTRLRDAGAEAALAQFLALGSTLDLDS